ncbi:MAG: hypothetical protein OQJ98_00395 [Candidatus Pacebacteria bacterium]|nr:hypothetical protein [Candidatus Paceibacterota bacterium]
MELFYLNLEYLFLLIYRFITGQGSAADGLAIPRELILFWDGVKIVSTLVSLLLLTGIIYSYIRLKQIRRAEFSQYGPKERDVVEETASRVAPDERWQGVLQHIHSENPNDWRHAIIEADTILDDIVLRAGYPGDTLGERMKGIERSDFRTIDQAWEAHKVRNRIAHEGSAYPLNKREALRIIDLYRQVFKEFFFIQE